MNNSFEIAYEYLGLCLFIRVVEDFIICLFLYLSLFLLLFCYSYYKTGVILLSFYCSKTFTLFKLFGRKKNLLEHFLSLL